jgi:hypothetical protein
VRGADGKLLCEPLRIVTAGGRRVALLGVLSPRLAPRGCKVDPPREAILQTLAEHQGRFDLVVVLAYLPGEELQQLATELPEADVVVGGPTGQSIPPRRIGPTLLASATNKGKFLAHLRPGRGGESTWSGQIVELDSSFADEPAQVANLDRYYRELRDRDLTADQTGLIDNAAVGTPAEYRVAGTQSCRDCHASDCQVWDASRHAHAWQTLQQRGAEADPSCQQCHVTGYGRAGGFASARRSPALVGVGCESCHGPSLAHAERAETRTAYHARAADQCVVCHDRENSPQFAFEPYWQRIEHGEPPQRAAFRQE